MRKVLKFVKGRRDDKKEHGSSGRSIGPFSDLPSPVDQTTPTDEHFTGFEQSFGYHVDLSGKDKTFTKLHKAAWQGNLEKLKVNMKKIDIDVVDRLNRTPLHLAAAQGHANVVWFLLGNKANFNICDNEGKTPFLKAIECGHKETIQLMLERGVDINTIDYSGNSGLHIAAKQGFYEIASMLLKQGANFESSNNFGEFPLHIATVAEHKDLVELLLRYGSSVNIVDRDNRSPLMFAAKCGSMTLVQLFLEYGAQRAVMDSNDWTAEDYALMGGHQDIAAELKSPSERMVMSFTEKSGETQGRDMGMTSTKRSVSDASLPPDQHEQEKEDANVVDKQNEEADNSDTWNDSQLSDSSLKQKGAGLKLTKFLPPSSDDEISEESIHSPRVQEMKDEEIQDSPRSCVIPPPCKPPRSWDLIQSGVIDDPKGLEPRRRSLLPLGSLRSRRESFNESPSAAESPSFHGDSPHVGQGDADQWLASQSFRKSDEKRDSLTRRHLNLSENEGNKDSPSTKYEDIQMKSIQGQEDSSRNKEKKEGSAFVGAGGDGMLDDIRSSKESLKGSSSDSDWDSDDSLPLDNYPPVANVTISPADNIDSPLKIFRVVNPNELEVPDTLDDLKDGSPHSLNAEKRNRFLMRAPSIDLTDDDTETGKNKVVHSPVSSELGKHKPELKEDSETDVNHSASGTLGRDGTLLGYEEVWESNAHAPKNNIALSGPSSSAGDTHISIKEELEEALVWSSPQFDGSSRVPTRPEGEKELSDDNLLYPSPRFDQKTKTAAVSENDICVEGVKKHSSVDEFDRRNNSLKLESRSLDTFESQKFVQETKIPRTRKHSRQQSISVQSWSKSEELHEKPPPTAHFDRMIEENKRINAQLRCYDEALRDLAHVSVVRKQSSLSLPRAKEVTGLARSQSAGSRNEGFFSLPSANDFAPREMAQSAIVKKQGSLSLPRTSEIPDFAMVQSLGPKKQGHSSLPCTNEFGIREMAQTAIVKRQGSLSLPRTCEIPDLSAAANEEYLSLPRSNELIDEAFKEIGQSSVTMKRGSRSLPRSIDAKIISSSADPVPPPRHKKTSHSRRRAESEGEASNRSSKDSVGSRSHSFDVKLQAPKGTELNASITKSPVKREGVTVSVSSSDADETPRSDNTISSGSMKDISLEKPIRKKRKMLLAMRGFLGPNLKSLNGSTVSEVSVEESFDEQPFWMSTDKGGPLERQATVIERPDFSSKGKIVTTLSPSRLETLESEEKDCLQQSPVKEQNESIDDTQPSNSLHEDVPLHEEVASFGEKEADEYQILPDAPQRSSPEIQRDSQSDDAESGPSHSDNTPQHVYTLKGHHNLLKQHLQKATAEKGRLEETAAELGEKAEKLKYELAEAREATRSRDEVITLLEEQLVRLEMMYTKSLEESQKYKLRLGNLEQELKHLKDVCGKHEEEKSHLNEIIRLKEMEKVNLDKSMIAKDEEQRLQAIIGEKEFEQKRQELEIHMNYVEIEKTKLKEEINKLETKNEDLRQKLDAVVTRNQLLSEEKAAIYAKNSFDIKTLQEHSEKWKQLYETSLEKLQLLKGSQKPSVDNEAQTSHAEREDFKDEVQQIIRRIEEAKEKDYIIWHNKIQEDVLNAVQLLNAEYSRVESSLVKHNEKLEQLVHTLLENLKGSSSLQVFHEEAGTSANSTTHEALKLVEELTLLNAELKDHYQQLRKQLESRQEELRKKPEILTPTSETGSGESSKVEQELRKETTLLKEQIKHILSQNPHNSREMWNELKEENNRLKEQVNILLEHIKQEEVKLPGESEVFQEDDTQTENVKLRKQNVELKEQLSKTESHSNKAIMTNITMLTLAKKTENQANEENIDPIEEENRYQHNMDCSLQEQAAVTCEQFPQSAQELWHELMNENIKLKKQMDLFEKHIKEKENMVNEETMTEEESGQEQQSEELYKENLKLKEEVILLKEHKRGRDKKQKETMTEPVVYELPEQYRDLLTKLKIENVKLRDQIHLFEKHIVERETMQDRIIIADVMECKYDEDQNIRPHSEIKQHKPEVNDAEIDLGILLEQEESDVGEASCSCLSKEDPEKVDDLKEALLAEDEKLEDFLNEKATIKKIAFIAKLCAENKELKQQLQAVGLELEEFQMKTVTQDFEKQPSKTKLYNVQTMTDPDIQLVHISMENAALQAQLQQFVKDYKKKKEELEKMSLLLRESRDASTLLLKEAKDANVCETMMLKKELEDTKYKLRSQEQEIIKNRVGISKESQPAKVTELCNLLDHLRKENTELQSQLKQMLTEKEEKDEVEIGFHNLHSNHVSLKDGMPHYSIGNLDERTATNKNLDSVACLFSMGCPLSLEEAQQIKTLSIKSDDIDIVDIPFHLQNFNVLTAQSAPTLNQEDPKPSVKLNDKHKNEMSCNDMTLHSELYKTKQNISVPNVDSKHPVLINSNTKEQELLSNDMTQSQLGVCCSTVKPTVHFKGVEGKEAELGCMFEKFEKESSTEQLQGAHAPKQSITSSQISVVSVKQQPFKANSSSSCEFYSEMKCCQNQMLDGMSSETSNSELASVSQDGASRTNFRPCRDAATNTTPSVQNLELQRELQLEKDRCKKYQLNVKKLKSDVLLLKNKLGESRKQGKLDSNLALKQNNNSNNSLLAGVPSPAHYDPNMAEFQRQVAELEQKVREENSMRFALEVQVNKMRYELQEKLQLEKELSVLRNRLEKDFVSRYELEQLRNTYEVALNRAKSEAELAARDDLNEKLHQINTFVEKQVQEQTRLSQLRNTTETQMKQDFQETRLKLLSELAKVQASLQAKGEEEKELREKCEKLTRECEKKHEIRRKKLIEKSYNVNLAPNSSLKEKELNSKGYMLDMKSPLHRPSVVQPVMNPISSPAVTVTTQVTDAWPSEHPFSHILRRELERSIRKHTRTDSLTENPSSSSPQTTSEEHLELLKKKYFLH